jgi:serine/threonine protein kinase
MGKVYRATHEALGKSVALKVVHTDDPSGEVSARFLQEGVAASRVRHPNVVEILDAGTDNGIAFMAMQLLDGETLADCLSRQGRLPPTYAVDLILPVCAALVAAHGAGVLHRDLKPANIFLADVGRGDPEPILLDFGISKILGPVDPELTQNPRFLGSPLYIAPEQADGAPGSPRSDQYSLALSLYEALLGVKPFAKYASSLIQLLRHVAEGEIRRPRELDASIPDELDMALCRALSTDPTKRFSSVREFGAALLPFASQARRTLWQQSFVDAERTMTSANAPVSDSTRSSRRVQVSVEEASATHRDRAPEPRGDEEAVEEGREDFLSHSSLFGGEPRSSKFDADKSSVSRRGEPFSQVPSDRSSGAWSEEEQGTSPSLDRWQTDLPSTYPVTFEVTPKETLIEIDGQQVGYGSFTGSFKNNQASHRARFSLAGHEPQTIVFQASPGLKQIALRPLAKEPAQGDASASKPAPPSQLADEPTPAAKAPRAPRARTGTPAPRAPAPAAAKPAEAPPSDPKKEAVPTEAKEEPAATKPPGDKRSIQTDNLDPWAP